MFVSLFWDCSYKTIINNYLNDLITNEAKGVEFTLVPFFWVRSIDISHKVASYWLTR